MITQIDVRKLYHHHLCSTFAILSRGVLRIMWRKSIVNNRIASAVYSMSTSTIHGDIHVPLIWQANSGGPCSVASSKKGQGKTCVHTHIVGLAVLGDSYGAAEEIDEKSTDDAAIGLGQAAWLNDEAGVSKKILRLLKIQGVLKFPVEAIEHLSDAARVDVVEKGSLIPCHENFCAICKEVYDKFPETIATALCPVRENLGIYLTKYSFKL